MRHTLAALICLISITSMAQRPDNPSSSEILHKLKKLNFLGSVLYVAAHPDDENTRLIAYLANERLANTAYLSLTRGDGGQNLVGPEIREGLGIIRTQELLAARRTDGGRQFFTRANDFGYSKSTDETQKIWDRDKVLSDVVLVYRRFKPDVVITRFPPDERAGHGHHTTSAIFAQEAFDLASRADAYKDQLSQVSAWQPKRLFMNTGRWWSPDINADTEGVVTVDVGGYNPLLGTSYPEMAARSRSQHKSQGFGSTGTRGRLEEYLELQKGSTVESDIFEGIDTSWKRVSGGAAIAGMVSQLIANFDPVAPEKSVSGLLNIRDHVSALPDQHWKTIKLHEIDEILKGMLGLYLEAAASGYYAAPGQTIELSVEAINRTQVPVTIEMVSYDHLTDTTFSMSLTNNERLNYKTNITIPDSWSASQPYWLKEQGTLGTYKVDDMELRGTPENQPALDVRFALDIDGHKIFYTVPVVYKWNDPVGGELYRPFNIVPAVVSALPESVYVFNGPEAKEVTVSVKAFVENLQANVRLEAPKGWEVTPSAQQVTIDKVEGETMVTFKVIPPKGSSVGALTSIVNFKGRDYTQSLQTIEYDHIPTQMLMQPASARVVKMEIERKGDRIGYIQGAGDAIPAALREIGYEVWEMSNTDVTAANLENIDAVILGIRALNTDDRADFYMPVLLDYVKQGGTLIVQYNTSFRLKTDAFAPYPLSISRDRVSEEDAPVKLLAPKHPALNTPNKIAMTDFDGWVQERGLYFPNEWADEYTALISSHDTNESDKDGGLLVAQYGKGYYVYSGYSWFRQLPAGVPGAYKLFVNLVSLGN